MRERDRRGRPNGEHRSGEHGFRCNDAGRTLGQHRERHQSQPAVSSCAYAQHCFFLRLRAALLRDRAQCMLLKQACSAKSLSAKRN
jgi:hypothetical protein